MKYWSWHRTRVLLLAVFLGLGMSLSFVQGGVMAAETAFAADDAHHGPHVSGQFDSPDHGPPKILTLADA